MPTHKYGRTHKDVQRISQNECLKLIWINCGYSALISSNQKLFPFLSRSLFLFFPCILLYYNIIWFYNIVPLFISIWSGLMQNKIPKKLQFSRILCAVRLNCIDGSTQVLYPSICLCVCVYVFVYVPLCEVIFFRVMLAAVMALVASHAIVTPQQIGKLENRSEWWW